MGGSGDEDGPGLPLLPACCHSGAGGGIGWQADGRGDEGVDREVGFGLCFLRLADQPHQPHQPRSLSPGPNFALPAPPRPPRAQDPDNFVRNPEPAQSIEEIRALIEAARHTIPPPGSSFTGIDPEEGDDALMS